MIQTISHIQTQPVYIEFLHPISDTVKNMSDHFLILQIQLHKVVISFPAFIPQAVIIIGISAQINMEPVQIRGILPFLQNILKGPEASSHMIENTVQHHPDSFFMKVLTDLFEILIGAQPAVHLPEIPGIIPMGIRLKQRGKIDGVCAKLLYMSNPAIYLLYSILLCCRTASVIFKRSPAESQRIYLIKNTFVSPHKCVLLSLNFVSPLMLRGTCIRYISIPYPIFAFHFFCFSAVLRKITKVEKIYSSIHLFLLKIHIRQCRFPLIHMCG